VTHPLKNPSIPLQNSPIQVGSIDLQDFEIPQSVRFGGRHRLIVHTLAGGQRIVERLGPDDNEIRFDGMFSGPSAETRARAFDNLRLSGDIVWLTWQSFRRRVIVKSFIADYHSPWWIHYQISCVVVDQIQIDSGEVVNLAAALSTDLSAALSAAVGSLISLTSLQTAVSARNSLTASTADQSRAIAAAEAAMEVIHDQMHQQSAMLVAPIPYGTRSADLGQFYTSKVDCAASLATATHIRSYVGRIGIYLAQSGA
jgi:hypothetical protein